MIVGDDIKYFQSSSGKITGRSYIDIEREARRAYNRIASQTKREPYIRSVYFRKEKIFLKPFWNHLHEKHEGDRKRRLKYFHCALDLIRNSSLPPESKNNPNSRNEIAHRFVGKTKTAEKFAVQIKEDNRTGKKYLMSVFPINK